MSINTFYNSEKIKNIVLSIMLFIFVLPILLFFDLNKSKDKILNVVGIDIKLEVVKTLEERMKGLMFRKELCDNCGMLFVFEKEDYRNFWMKNTLIPLDMIFINENFRVVNFVKATPCLKSHDDQCTAYSSKEKAKYVLEVNSNVFNEKLIGQTVHIFGFD